jgi:mannose-1-phosphate guanylyltransferase
MQPIFVPVILAGGKGERFWPLSRKERPKQFLCLDGSGFSLLQATAKRLIPISLGWEHLWVVTAPHLANGIREQLPQLPNANLLVEPEGRDTAPAVAWSLLEIIKRYGENVVVGFFPADHWIGEPEAFIETLKAAAEIAMQQQAIVTLGIAPNRPAIGYGYIEQGEAIDRVGELQAYRVSRFTEKPDLPTAETFLSTGRFSWNSGIFVFPAQVALTELRQHAPDLMHQLEEKGVEAYPQLPRTSIDYALMEKTHLACVLPVAFGWDDLGDWGAIERLLKKSSSNTELANHVGRDTQGSIFYTSDLKEVVVTIGLEDVVVVRDGGVTLIVKKDRTQEIKHVLKAIQENPEYEHLL